MKKSILRPGTRLFKTAKERQEFISLSRNYKNNDEKTFPYAEMSARGRALYTMSEILKICQNGIIISPGFADPAFLLMRAQGNSVFRANKSELTACIAAQSGSDVFDYWRQPRIQELGDSLKFDFPDKFTFWINPKLSDLQQHAENTIAGYVGQNVEDELLEALGQAQLVNAIRVPNGFWLTR